MRLESIQQLIQAEMDAVNDCIRDSLYSQVELINTISEYIINSGGKRARPMLVILSAKALCCDNILFIQLATIIEFIHTATLLHDDVVDGSLLRRGVDTANAKWGSQASVLVGDFLYSRAFQMMVALNNMAVMDVLANTTNTISEGEVLQLLNAHDSGTDESNYMKVIRCKTAELFRAAMQLGAIASGVDTQTIAAMAEYGLQFGLAYQLIDDVLDYCSDAETMGKNVGDDLAEGKPTLPLIYALRHGNEQQRQIIADAIQRGTSADLSLIQQIIQDTGALTYTRQQARLAAERAIASLTVVADSAYKQALIALAEFAVKRNY